MPNMEMQETRFLVFSTFVGSIAEQLFGRNIHEPFKKYVRLYLNITFHNINTGNSLME